MNADSPKPDSPKQYEKMTFSELKDTSFEVDPPIPPGEFLQGNKHLYTVYPKYKGSVIDSWMVTVGKHLENATNFQLLKQSGEASGLNILQTIMLSHTETSARIRITTPQSLVGEGRYQLRAMDTHSHDVVRCPMPIFIEGNP